MRTLTFHDVAALSMIIGFLTLVPSSQAAYVPRQESLCAKDQQLGLLQVDRGQAAAARRLRARQNPGDSSMSIAASSSAMPIILAARKSDVTDAPTSMSASPSQSLDPAGSAGSNAVLAARSNTANSAPFPRLAAISFAGRYDKEIVGTLAKFGLSVIGTPEPRAQVVREIKAINPKALVGFYTVLNEARRGSSFPLAKERAAKLEQEGWWLKDESGNIVQWSKDFGSWDVNATDWVKPDSDGLRYPQWVASFWYRWLFSTAPEADVWFFDNVFIGQRIKAADWRLTGKNQRGDDPEIQSAFRRAQATEVSVAKGLAPDKLMLGNTDNDLGSPEYSRTFHGGLMECLVGVNWSIETWGGWERMMERYRKVSANLSAPSLTVFGLCMNDTENTQLLRYALASSLMGDAYFMVTGARTKYIAWPWFDEFNVDLGRPIDGPFPEKAEGGYYQRRFTKGMVIVNPSGREVEVPIGGGYTRIAGQQAPQVNSGRPVTSVRIPSKDGIVLLTR